MGIQVQPCCCPKVLTLGWGLYGNYHITSFDLATGKFGTPVDTNVRGMQRGRYPTGLFRRDNGDLYAFENVGYTESEYNSKPGYVIRFDKDTWQGSLLSQITPREFAPGFGQVSFGSGGGMLPAGEAYYFNAYDARFIDGYGKYWATSLDAATGVHTPLSQYYLNHADMPDDRRVPSGGCCSPLGYGLVTAGLPIPHQPDQLYQINLTTGQGTLLFEDNFFLNQGTDDNRPMVVDPENNSLIWLFGVSGSHPTTHHAYGTLDITNGSATLVGEVPYEDSPYGEHIFGWTF